MPTTVSVDAAAILFGVTKRTIYNWIRTGTLKTIKLPMGQRVIVPANPPHGRAFRVHVDRLKHWLER